MSFLRKLIGADITSPVEAIGSALDKLLTSDDERAAAAAVLEKLRQNPGALQVELNKIEAAHRSVFVAGWRPFIGWVCGCGLGFVFLANPVIQWWTGEPGPVLPMDAMMELVVAMLGLSGLRTFEKVQGRAK